MNPILHTDRLDLIETSIVRPSFTGDVRCIYVNAWDRHEPAPCILAASMLLVEHRSGWLLQHILVEDEGRQCGFATELVRFYEDRLGSIGAAWVSDSGKKFARAYIERFGPRPHWQIGTPANFERIIEQVMGRAPAGSTGGPR